MSRPTSIVLGSSLLALWLVGIFLRGSAPLAWIDGAAGVALLVLSSYCRRRPVERTNRCCVSMALAMGLLLVWALGLGFGVMPLLSWGTFGIACAMLLISFAATDAPHHGS